MNTPDVLTNGSVAGQEAVPAVSQPTTSDTGAASRTEEQASPKTKYNEKRKIGLEKVILIFAQVLTFLTLVLLWDQTHELSMQTKLNQDSFRLSASAAELSFNLDVMTRLQEVQFKVADDEQCFRYVWGEKVTKPVTPNGKAEQCGDAVLDVLSMALAAVDRMPGFSRNNDDWSSYTTYVMEKSPNLKQRVHDHPEWWPEVTPYAR